MLQSEAGLQWSTGGFIGLDFWMKMLLSRNVFLKVPKPLLPCSLAGWAWTVTQCWVCSVVLWLSAAAQGQGPSHQTRKLSNRILSSDTCSVMVLHYYVQFYGVTLLHTVSWCYYIQCHGVTLLYTVLWCYITKYSVMVLLYTVSWCYYIQCHGVALLHTMSYIYTYSVMVLSYYVQFYVVTLVHTVSWCNYIQCHGVTLLLKV